MKIKKETRCLLGLLGGILFYGVVAAAALMLGYNLACADTIVEGGVAILSSNNSGGQTLIVVERFSDKYDIGVGAITSQRCDCRDFKPDLDRETPVDPLTFLFAQRIWNWKKVEFGLGFGVWNKTSRVSGSTLMVPLMLRYRITDRLFISARHFSTAGSGEPNLGQDMITGAWRF